MYSQSPFGHNADNASRIYTFLFCCSILFKKSIIELYFFSKNSFSSTQLSLESLLNHWAGAQYSILKFFHSGVGVEIINFALFTSRLLAKSNTLFCHISKKSFLEIFSPLIFLYIQSSSLLEKSFAPK